MSKSDNIRFWTDDRGYSYLEDPSSGEIVHLHHLNALVHSSLDTIIRDDVEIHHELSQWVDAPDAVTPVNQVIHRRLHEDGDGFADPDEVLPEYVGQPLDPDDER